jgi:integrase
MQAGGWHILRHTFASHLAMRGVPLPAIKELMGVRHHNDHDEVRACRAVNLYERPSKC